MPVDVGSPTYWVIKFLIAAPGAYVFWRAYRAYRRRRIDPSTRRDPTTDRWWRRLFLGMTVAGADLVAMLVLHNTIGMSGWLLWSLVGVLSAAVLLAFAASFMIGWRAAS